jgi:general secretion pathway protein C
MRKYQRKWFKQAFADTKNLPQQISTELTGDGHEPFGFRIIRFAENSVFRKIGLNQGDIINDVNGEPVKTAQQLVQAVQALQSVSKGNNYLIRIERLKNDHFIDPIYIYRT